MNQQRMTNACRLLADHVQQAQLDESLYEELKFLRTEMVTLLLDKGNQEELFQDFEQQFEDEVQNPCLRELTNRYFN